MSLLERLAQQSAILNEKTDALNEALTRAEAALKSLKAGVTASVEIGVDGGKLGFGKLDQQWRLIYFAPNGEAAPLATAGRNIRVLAAGSLERLLEAMAGSVPEEIASVTRAIVAVEHFIERVGKKT